MVYHMKALYNQYIASLLNSKTGSFPLSKHTMIHKRKIQSAVCHTSWWRAWWRGCCRSWWWRPNWRSPSRRRTRIRCPRSDRTSWIKNLHYRLLPFHLHMSTILSRSWYLCWYSVGGLRLIHWHWGRLGPRRLVSSRWWLWWATVVRCLGRSCLIERRLREGWWLGCLWLVSCWVVELCLRWRYRGLISRTGCCWGRLRSLMWLVVCLLWLLLLWRDTIAWLLLKLRRKETTHN